MSRRRPPLRKGQRQALRAVEAELARLGRAPGTATCVLGELERFLRHADTALRAVQPEDVRRHLAELADLGVAASTQAHVLSAIRAGFKALLRAGLVDRDPTDRLRVPRGERSPRLLLSEAQVQRLLAAALALGPGRARPLALRDRALLELLYGLGLRASESCAARLADLSLTDGALVVRRAKGGEPRALPLTPRALDPIGRYLEEARPRLVWRHDPGRLLVTRDGRRLTTDTVQRVVKATGERAGVPGCHPHALRRALACHLVTAGASVRAVQLLLGHADLETTQLYVEPGRGAMCRAIELLDRGS